VLHPHDTAMLSLLNYGGNPSVRDIATDRKTQDVKDRATLRRYSPLAGRFPCLAQCLGCATEVSLAQVVGTELDLISGRCQAGRQDAGLAANVSYGSVNRECTCCEGKSFGGLGLYEYMQQGVRTLEKCQQDQ